ncbi:MAG: cadherin domain-containing protein, partial [Caldilineaceae bacterium]|nr:cadherin domain-containing protein [Caldilineaceae bacterium]
LPDGVQDASAGSITVPINFVANGHAVSSLGFALDYNVNQSCLTLDETDGDNNGIPDAVSGFPSGFVPTVLHDAGTTNGELQIGLHDQTDPLNALSDGPIAEVIFAVDPACVTTDGTTTDITIQFASAPAHSFGTDSGDPINGSVSGGGLQLQFNAEPTDIGLDNDTVDENEPAGTVVGNLSTVDADAGDSHTYSLVAGAGDGGNASFTIVGSELRTAASFDFESEGGYSIRIRTDDGNGGTFEKSFPIGVNDINEAPTGLTLDNQSVDENLPSGTTVGALTTSGDPDTGDSHSYSLTGGDTSAFDINGGILETAQSFNFEDQETYAVTVRTTDDGGLFYEESVTITINDLNDAPVAADDIFDPLTVIAVGPTTLDVLANDSDEDAGALLYIESVSSSNAAIIDLIAVDDGLEYIPPAGNGSESFTYIAT